MGPPQFIPSSYRRYAVDGDGDGIRDLIDNWDDILASVANYFVANGWRPDQPVAAAGVTEMEIDVPAGRTKFKPDETVASLSNRGLSFEAELDASTPAKLISLEGENGPGVLGRLSQFLCDHTIQSQYDVCAGRFSAR